MKNKYISLNELSDVIDSDLEYVDNLYKDIDHTKKRISYLELLRVYLIENDFCPIVRKEVIDSDILLQEFVMPILLKNNSKSYAFIGSVNSKDYGVEFDTIDILLHDFVNYVCKCKGHKIGVGDFLIDKFIKEMCK